MGSYSDAATKDYQDAFPPAFPPVVAGRHQPNPPSTTRWPDTFINDRCSISWEDITEESSWVSDDVIADLKPTLCETLGVVLFVEDGVLYVASSVGEGFFGDVHAIPCSVIRTIHRLREV